MLDSPVSEGAMAAGGLPTSANSICFSVGFSFGFIMMLGAVKVFELAFVRGFLLASRNCCLVRFEFGAGRAWLLVVAV